MTGWLKRCAREVWAVARRECRYILDDSRLRTVVLIAPFVYAFLFIAIYSGHTLYDVPIAVLQQDHSQATRTLVRMLEASPKLNIAYRSESMTDVQNLMIEGRIDAAVVIPKGTTTRLKHGRDTYITAYVNAASMVSANIAAKAVNEVVQTFSAGVELKTLMKKGERLHQAREHFMPEKLDLRPMFNPDFNYSNFLVPGILIAVLQQVILLGVALSWTGEKERGTLGQLFGLASSPLRVLIGKALPYFAINAVVAEIFLRVLFPLSDIPMQGSWPIAITFTFLFILTVVTWGMWVSGLCRTRLFATQVLMFVAMPSFVLSGFTWPLQAMPAAVRFLSHLLPMTYFVNSFRRIYLAEAPMEYLVRDFATLAAFTALNIALAWGVARWLWRQSQLTQASVSPDLSSS